MDQQYEEQEELIHGAGLVMDEIDRDDTEIAGALAGAGRQLLRVAQSSSAGLEQRLTCKGAFEDCCIALGHLRPQIKVAPEGRAAIEPLPKTPW